MMATRGAIESLLAQSSGPALSTVVGTQRCQLQKTDAGPRMLFVIGAAGSGCLSCSYIDMNHRYQRQFFAIKNFLRVAPP
jgi:hypothetical protein